MAQKPDDNKTITEEIEVAGSQLLERVKELIEEGHVRRIRIKEPDGDLVVEMPLNVGVVAGSAVVLAAPLLAVLGVLAALLVRVRIEIVREGGQNRDTTSGGGPTA